MKKILSLILCISFVFACVHFSANSEMTSGRLPELIIASATPAEFVQKAYKLGDINNDKTHNFIDYLLLKRAFIGTYELTDVQRSAADINGDGRVGGVDYLMLKRSAMKYFNIKQPQTSPDEVELTDMAYGYYEYKKSLESFQWMPFEASDVTIIKSRVYGKYGDGNCYIVFGMITGYGYIDCEHEIEVGGRTIILRDCNEPLVWDGSAMHDIWTAYENGLIDDVDLEDFQARETLV